MELINIMMIIVNAQHGGVAYGIGRLAGLIFLIVFAVLIVLKLLKKNK